MNFNEEINIGYFAVIERALFVLKDNTIKDKFSCFIFLFYIW